MDCELNKPMCKRKLMMKQGPFEKNKSCPLSGPPPCPLAPPKCPLAPEQKNNCPISKIVGGDGKKCPLVQNSCPCDPNPPCPIAYEDAEDPKISSSLKSKKSICPATFPVLSNCPKKINKKQIKQMPNPCPNVDSEKKQKDSPKGKLKEVNSATSGFIESGIISESLGSLSKPSYAMVKKGINVPDCTLASTRPLPCSECLGELLANPEKSPGCKLYDTDCPYLKRLNMCDDSCLCEDVPRIDCGPPCPFAPKQCPCCATIKCPLTRIPDCPLVSQQPQKTPKKPSCKCHCPVVPPPCSLDIPPLCKVHKNPCLKPPPKCTCVKEDQKCPLVPGLSTSCPLQPPPPPPCIDLKPPCPPCPPPCPPPCCPLCPPPCCPPCPPPCPPCPPPCPPPCCPSCPPCPPSCPPCSPCPPPCKPCSPCPPPCCPPPCPPPCKPCSPCPPPCCPPPCPPPCKPYSPCPPPCKPCQPKPPCQPCSPCPPCHPKPPLVPTLLVPPEILGFLDEAVEELNKFCTCNTPPPPQIVNMIPSNLPMKGSVKPPCISKGDPKDCPLECPCEPPRTFHVPTCSKKNPPCLQSFPKSKKEGELVCPFYPRCCPLGRICPFPVPAKTEKKKETIKPPDKCNKKNKTVGFIQDKMATNKTSQKVVQSKETDVKAETKVKKTINRKKKNELEKSDTPPPSKCPLSNMPGDKKKPCPFAPAPCPLDPIKPLTIREPKVCPFAPKPPCPLMPKPLCPPAPNCLMKPLPPMPECPYAPPGCPLAPKKLCFQETPVSYDCPCPPPPCPCPKPQPCCCGDQPPNCSCPKPPCCCPKPQPCCCGDQPPKCPCPEPDPSCPCPKPNPCCPCPDPDPSCPCPKPDPGCPCPEPDPGCPCPKPTGCPLAKANPGCPCPDPEPSCPCPKPDMGCPCPEPDTGCPCPKPNPCCPCPDPDPSCPCPKPDPGCPCPEPDPGCPCPKPTGCPLAKANPGCPRPDPEPSCPCPKPDTGCPCPEPDTGCPCPEPDPGCPCPKPNTGCPLAKANPGCPCSDPEPSCPCPKPDTGCPCPEPDTGCPCPKPNPCCPCPDSEPSCPCPKPDPGCPCSEPDPGCPCPKPTGCPLAKAIPGCPCPDPKPSCPCPKPDSGCPCPEPDTGCPCPKPDTGCPLAKANSTCPCPDPNPSCSCPKPDTGCPCPEPNPGCSCCCPSPPPPKECPLIPKPLCPLIPKFDSNCPIAADKLKQNPYLSEKTENPSICKCSSGLNATGGCACGNEDGGKCPCSMLAKKPCCPCDQPVSKDCVVKMVIDKLKKAPKMLEDCPLKIPPCDKFPEGRCPMEDLGLCDCNYPIPPCMLPPQCGTASAPPQYCVDLNCCMGLPLPPVVSGEIKSKDDKATSYYKFVPSKPGKEETKYYVEILDHPPVQFPFGPPKERPHSNWYIVKYGTAYEKCKTVAEKLKKRKPCAEGEAQFNLKDIPMDPQTKLILENRKNQERLNRGGEN